MGSDELLSRAVKHMDDGEHTAAVPILLQALDGCGHEATIRKNIAVCYSCQDNPRYADALTEIRRAAELSPDDDGMQRALAILLLRFGQVDDAMAALDLAIEQDDQDKGAYFYRAIAQRSRGQLRDASADLDHAEELGFERGKWPTYVRALIAGDGHDRHAAVELLSDVLASLDDPATPDRSDDDALRAAALGAKARYLGQLDRLHEGVTACDRAIFVRPNSPYVEATRAWLLHRMGDLEEAESAVLHAIEHLNEETSPEGRRWLIFLNEAAIYNTLADQYGQRDLHRDALDASRAAQADLKSAPANAGDEASRRERQEREALIFFERARAHLALKEDTAATSALRECRKRAPRDSRPWIASTRILEAGNPSVKEIPSSVILVSATILLGMTLGLTVAGVISAPYFVTALLSIPALALAAFAFPVLTQLKVGAVEIQKTVVAASSATLRAIPPPPPLPEVEMPSPRQTVDGRRKDSPPTDTPVVDRSMGAPADV